MSWGFELQPDELDSGAETTTYAAGLAKRASSKLDGAELAHGMFGDFDAAHSFHGTVTSAHGRHLERLNSHHSMLTSTSEKVSELSQRFRRADNPTN
jgi:hypothetical protein